MTLPPKHSHLIWDIKREYETGEKAMEHVFSQIRNRGQLSPLSHWSPLATPLQQVAYGYTQLWLSLMGNYTVVNIRDKVECSSIGKPDAGKIDMVHIDLSLQQYVKGLHLFPYFLNDDLGSLGL